MKARELFEVLIRVRGVWEFVSGLGYLPQWVVTFSRPLPYDQSPLVEAVMMLGMPGLKMILGVALFFGARKLTEYTFRETAPTPGDMDSEETDPDETER